MFSLFIELLGLSSSLARVAKVPDQTIFFLNDEPCMFRYTIIYLNPVELKYYLFMISLNKCAGSCNALSPKEINVKAFNIKKIKMKLWQNILHMIVNLNSIVQYVIQIKSGIIKHVSVNVKIIIGAKKGIVGILAHVFVKIVSF